MRLIFARFVALNVELQIDRGEQWSRCYWAPLCSGVFHNCVLGDCTLGCMAEYLLLHYSRDLRTIYFIETSNNCSIDLLCLVNLWQDERGADIA